MNKRSSVGGGLTKASSGRREVESTSTAWAAAHASHVSQNRRFVNADPGGSAMSTVVQLLLILGVFATFAVLLILLHRWGERHDPMGGRSTDTWSTTGRSKRVDRDDD